MPRDALQRAGLSAPEADVYLACLKLGTQDLAVIAREVGLPPADAMQLLRRLLDRGFMSRYTSGKRVFYTAEPPRMIQRLLDRTGTGTALASILSVLEASMLPGHERPDVVQYEGRDGMLAAYEDTLSATTEIVAVASIDDTESVLQKYMPTYYKRRKSAGIPIRAIFPDTPMSRRRRAEDRQELRESRLLPQSLMQVQIEWNVYDDKVVFFSLAEEIAVRIRSRLIADAMRAAFEVHWRLAAFVEESGKTIKPVSKPRPKKRRSR